MKTYDELREQWNGCTGQGQVLVDYSHPLRMYLNINDEGNKELLIPVKRHDRQFKSTAAIGIRNYENRDSKYIAIELLHDSLESEYLCLCYDLIESSRHYTDESNSRTALFESLKKWYYLLADIGREILPEREIRGLLGELRYMLDELTAGVTDLDIVRAWKIHKDASKDFLFTDTWSEIKTIDSAKDYITISSLDQLTHDTPGILVLYKLDKTEFTNPIGISLNDMVKSVRSLMGFQAETELNHKLLSRGYIFNEQYDNILFLFHEDKRYRISEDFPCITRDTVPSSIIRVNYDIRLSEIERWCINGE